MIRTVKLGREILKQIEKRQIPTHILIKLQDWVEQVEKEGVQAVRKIPGYHDEPLKGDMAGLRSIRLAKGWRAYYKVMALVKALEFIEVWRVDKHVYRK